MPRNKGEHERKLALLWTVHAQRVWRPRMWWEDPADPNHYAHAFVAQRVDSVRVLLLNQGSSRDPNKYYCRPFVTVRNATLVMEHLHAYQEWMDIPRSHLKMLMYAIELPFAPDTHPDGT